MRLEDNIDYSKYTVEELHDVARHIDRVRYADRYARVLEEFEKRSGLPMPPEPPRHTPRVWLTQELWKHGDARRDFAAIVAWWEERRKFYNQFFFAVAACNLLTTCGLIFVRVFRDGLLHQLLPNSFQAAATSLFGLVLWTAIIGAFAFLFLNALYVLLWMCDGLLSIPLRFLGWRLSVALLAIVLSLTFLILSVPTIFTFYAAWSR